MKSAKTSILVIAALTISVPTIAQTVTEITIPVPATSVSITDVNSDGTLIAGSYAGAYPDRFGFIYDRTTGRLTDLGLIDSTKVVISDDGTVAAAMQEEPTTGASTAARWTMASGTWEMLPVLGAPCSGSLNSLYDMSSDGEHFVGLAWLGCGATAFRWSTSSGMELMLGIRANAVNDDGTRITGFDHMPTGPRTWAIWDDGVLSTPTPAEGGEGQAISSDGSVMAGMWWQDVVRYTAAGGFEVLGPGKAVFSMSNDGDAILALSAIGLEYWTPALGYVNLQNHLGSAMNGYSWTYFPNARMSGDGNTIVANGMIGDPFSGTPVVLVIEPNEAGCPCACNFDTSTGAGVCDIFDFLAFQNSFVGAESCACDIDTSTGSAICDIFDFLAFQNAFVSGCP